MPARLAGRHDRDVAGAPGLGGLAVDELEVGRAEDRVARPVDELGHRVVDEHVAPVEVLDVDGVAGPLDDHLQQPVALFGAARGAPGDDRGDGEQRPEDGADPVAQQRELDREGGDEGGDAEGAAADAARLVGGAHVGGDLADHPLDVAALAGAAAVDRVADRAHQRAAGLGALDEEVLGAGADHAARQLLVVVAGEHHHGQVRHGAQQPLDAGGAARVRQLEVEQHAVRVVGVGEVAQRGVQAREVLELRRHRLGRQQRSDERGVAVRVLDED